MARKSKRTAADEIETLARERVMTGKQLFDYRTKRLKPKLRTVTVARAVLIRAQVLSAQLDTKLVLRAQEKRLLASIGMDPVPDFFFSLNGLLPLPAQKNGS